LVGSSGVGKSTLVNRLVGDELQATQDVRVADDRGRHTTTFRALVSLPGGAVLVDTPGMRELAPWIDAQSNGSESPALHDRLENDASEPSSAEPEEGGVFRDIVALASQCRFGDCRHGSEPDCAVKAAIDAGTLDGGRFASFLKLGREQAYLERKLDVRAQFAERQRWKKISKAQRRHYRAKG
jgi:ribosome biogenesis GTPase